MSQSRLIVRGGQSLAVIALAILVTGCATWQEFRTKTNERNALRQQLEETTRLEVKRVVLFGGGEDELAPKGLEAAGEIADMLTKFPDYRVRVEGHTDNRPIAAPLKEKFETNWELSAARASTVVRYLVDNLKVDPARVQAVGYGSYRPIADNTTADGRAKNRRVEVVIFKEPPQREPLKAGR